MLVTNIHAAKTHLSRLIKRVERGEEIVIARAGKPVARLVPAEPKPAPIELGSERGKIIISDDFDEPLSEDFLFTPDAPAPRKSKRRK